VYGILFWHTLPCHHPLIFGGFFFFFFLFFFIFLIFFFYLFFFENYFDFLNVKKLPYFEKFPPPPPPPQTKAHVLEMLTDGFIFMNLIGTYLS